MATSLSFGTDAAITLAGAPVGEPTLGPAAFMHRASAADCRLHLSGTMSLIPRTSLLASSLRRSIAAVGCSRASVFNGREPDENRWDFDFGALDSVAGRVTGSGPRGSGSFKLSSGRLKDPEELGARRHRADHSIGIVAEARAARTSRQPRPPTASTTATTSTAHRCVLEATKRSGALLDVSAASSSSKLKPASLLDDHSIGPRRERHGIGTYGRRRPGAASLAPAGDGRRRRGDVLCECRIGCRRRYGVRPVSLQVFLRLRPAAGAMGRMWNMHMIKPMHPAAADPHAGHQMP